MSTTLLQVGVIYSYTEHSHLEAISELINEAWNDEPFKILAAFHYLKSTSFNCFDVGCGTGHWITQVLDEFQECKIKGIDLSPLC